MFVTLLSKLSFDCATENGYQASSGERIIQHEEYWPQSSLRKQPSHPFNVLVFIHVIVDEFVNVGKFCDSVCI